MQYVALLSVSLERRQQLAARIKWTSNSSKPTPRYYRRYTRVLLSLNEKIFSAKSRTHRRTGAQIKKIIKLHANIV